LEAHAGRPLVEGSDPGGLECRSVVVLAEPGSPVAVVAQNRADRRLVLGDEAVVAGVACRLLGDHAEAGGMVVAAGNECGAGRRTERRRVEIRIAQATVRDAIE